MGTSETVVAVLEPLEVTRSAMVAGLVGGGFTPRCVGSVDELARSRAPYALCHVDDQALDGLEAFTTACPATAVVAARSPHSRVPARWFLSAGAVGVVCSDSTPAAFGAALQAVACGLVVVPASETDARLGAVRPALLRSVSDQERAWLADLAAGCTIATIAQRSRLSEREVYRRLDRLYSRLGVNGRAGAVAFAGEWGLLGFPDPDEPERPHDGAVASAGTSGARRAVG
jgi:DNA-binding NarL/FixJ family response regulator